MKLDALDHPKTLDFAARLNVELPTALGHLELLWAFTAKKSPQGNLGKWPDGSIARACYWNRDPTAFVTALASAGFIDAHPKHRWLIHDWHDHAPRWVMSQLARAKLQIIDSSSDSSPDSSADLSEDCSRDSSADSVRHGMAGVEKASHGRGGAHAPSSNGVLKSVRKTEVALSLHESLPLDAWQNWLDFRRERRFPLSHRALSIHLKLLAKYEAATQREIIETSIQAGWQGLFAPKGGTGRLSMTEAFERNRRDFVGGGHA